VIDPRDVLKEARQCLRSGSYAEALEKYLWFHQNALAHRPSLRGVRLSYALSEWVRLGELYPPARAALLSRLEDNTRSLRVGSKDWDQFQEVAAIYRELKQEAKTTAVFQEIVEHDLDFAKKCFSIALPALIATQDFALARTFIPSPSTHLNEHLEHLLEAMKRDDVDDLQAVLLKLYAKQVTQLLSVLKGVGEGDEAQVLAARAIESIGDPEQRAKVRALLGSDGVVPTA
jgi:hypothetical protein